MTQSATVTTSTKRSVDCGETTTVKRAKCSNAQLQSELFCLPREIRNLIFTFALAKSPPLALLDSTHLDASDSEPALLYTCHRARDEALPIFYQSNDWIIKTRRVGGDTGRLDPVSKRLMTYQCIPLWLDALPDEKIALIKSIVVVGSRGSYVNINGKWKDGERAAFRLRTLNRRLKYHVQEVLIEDKEHHQKEEEKDIFCSIQLVHLLRARMRISVQDTQGSWLWTKDRIHDLAVLL